MKVDVEGAVRSKPDKKIELLEVWRLHNGSTSHDVGSYYSTLLYMRTTCAVIVINILKKQS